MNARPGFRKNLIKTINTIIPVAFLTDKGVIGLKLHSLEGVTTWIYLRHHPQIRLP